VRGTIRQDESGKWYYQFTTVEGGKRRHHRKRGFARKRDASAELSERLSAYGHGDKRALRAPSTQPLAAYLTEWLRAREHTLNRRRCRRTAWSCGAT
jgi:hypothetical protein